FSSSRSGMERASSSAVLIENEENEEREGFFSRFLNFIGKSEENDEENFSDVKPVPFLDLFRFASGKERMAIGVAIFLSIVMGMCTPAHIYLTGVITTALVDVKEPVDNIDFLHHIWQLSSLYAAFFIFTFVVGYIENWMHVWASERIAQRLSTSASAAVVRLSEESNGISEEAILNLKAVASCNGEKTMIQRYASSLLSSIAPSTRCGFFTALYYATASLVHIVFHTAGSWYGTIRYHSGSIEHAGVVFAVVNIAIGSASSFTMLGPHLLAVVKARVAAAKVYHTIDSQEDAEEKVQTSLDPTNAEMHLALDNVSFTFPGRSLPAVQQLSFDLSPGESLALVGKSGCGKSTTLKLVTRFLSGYSGRILLDGQPFDLYDKKKWRRMVGVVSQEPSIFTGSIRDNICLGRPFTQVEVENACRIAYAHEFISELEEGYSTLLGPSGVSLSGGQKQRIAIARAIIANTRLLLLDEATSALDSRSERIVQEALDAASEGRTTIVVAHRLSTIKNVQRNTMNSGVVQMESSH
ncbi:hypothetical protein PMAYCL1PPCAC_19146, partial [Pristionchus mayeri]